MSGNEYNQLECNDDDASACSGQGGIERDSAVEISLNPGDTVLLRVSKFGSSKVGDFFLNIAAPCDGDYEPDGDVDGSDLAVFAADFGRTDCSNDCEGDFNSDDDVDGSDLAVFVSDLAVFVKDFGRTDCPTSN